MSHSIGTTAIPTPQKFIVTDVDITRDARLASGRMVIDRIATKKEFHLDWVHLTGAQVDSLLTLLNTDSFFTYTYPDEVGSNTVTVTCKDIPRELWLNDGDKLYRGVTVRLIEQ